MQSLYVRQAWIARGPCPLLVKIRRAKSGSKQGCISGVKGVTVAESPPESTPLDSIAGHGLEAEPCLTISEKYTSLGGSSGVLGVPSSEERPTTDGMGRYRDYQWGSIYWIPQTCAHEIHVPIKDKWISLNAERGLGYPITDVMHPRGSERLPAATVPLWSYLQRGAIYALPRRPEADGRGSITYEVHGGIWEKYRALGAEHSFLGYPVTDETSTSDNTGRFNHFQHGSIYWTRGTGAHEVHGAIRAKYIALGGPGSFLAYPISDETRVGDFDIGRSNAFQGGPIYWTPETGAHEMHDETILNKWMDMSEFIPGRSTLGWPTSDVYGSAGSFRQDFQNGYITDIDNRAASYCRMQGSGCDHVIDGGGGQSQATVTIQLVRQPIFEGSIPYVSRFPTVGSINGNLIRVTNPSPNIILRFPKRGHNTAECNIDADVISLGTGAATSTQDLSQIFGSGSPRLPVTFVCCVVTVGQAPDSVLLSVTYSYTP